MTKKGDIDDISLKIEIKPGIEGHKEAILARLKDELQGEDEPRLQDRGPSLREPSAVRSEGEEIQGHEKTLDEEDAAVSAQYKIKEMDEKIQLLRKTAEELMALGGEIEAVKKNLVRLLASTKMLELNISDVKNLL